MDAKRVVCTSFWADPKTDDFTPEDKYFFLYLLTNPSCRLLGIYKFSIKTAAFQLGYSVEAVKNLLDRFENKYHMIIYSKETSEIAIKNYMIHSIVKGGKPVADCLHEDINSVKNRELIDSLFAYLDTKRDRLLKTIKIVMDDYISLHSDNVSVSDNDNVSVSDNDNVSVSDNDNVSVSDNDNVSVSDNDNDNDSNVDVTSTIRQRNVDVSSEKNELEREAINAIVDYLNSKAGTSFKANSKSTMRCIHARFKEGFKIEDFRRVIDRKCNDWINDPKMREYLRPITLFGTKFESYLNGQTSGTAGSPYDYMDDAVEVIDPYMGE